MIKKENIIDFVAVKEPSLSLESKLGGQPNWLEKPEWPLSKSLGKQMRFIAQIKIDKVLFPESKAEMAYVFMTDDKNAYADNTWDPDAGENAVILQPGETTVPVVSKATGPTLQKTNTLKSPDVEFILKTEKGTDPSFLSEESLSQLKESEIEDYLIALEGDKIGGTPGFIQGDEFPSDDEKWLLLLQLDSDNDKFSVNFGDEGLSFTFINKEGTKAKFLWQCS